MSEHLKMVWFWGNQIRNKTVINDKDWAFGDKAEFNSWVQMPLSKSVSISSRLNTVHQDKVSGRDVLISAPVQTADPRNYGGHILSLLWESTC